MLSLYCPKEPRFLSSFFLFVTAPELQDSADIVLFILWVCFKKVISSFNSSKSREISTYKDTKEYLCFPYIIFNLQKLKFSFSFKAVPIEVMDCAMVKSTGFGATQAVFNLISASPQWCDLQLQFPHLQSKSNISLQGCMKIKVECRHSSAIALLFIVLCRHCIFIILFFGFFLVNGRFVMILYQVC